MEYSGQIILYDYCNNPVSIKTYHNRWKRNFIISDWKNMYASSFYNCYYVISPNVDTKDVDLLNFKMKRPKYEEKSIYNTPKYSYKELFL